MINSLKLYETLKSANLSEVQARAIAAGIETALGDHDSEQEKNLAQKMDTARFETEMHQTETSLGQKIDRVETSLRSEIHRVDASLRHKIDQVEASLKQEIQGVRTALAETKFEMLRWLFIFWAGQVAATVSVIKLLR
jgi:hypothetical protein